MTPMPDPRYAHCPACAGGRPDCPRCDGEGIVEEWPVVDLSPHIAEAEAAAVVLAELYRIHHG